MPMSQWLIRNLAPRDAAPVAEIESLIAGHPRTGFMEKRFAALAAHPDRFLTCAALEGGSLLGYVFARLQEGEFGHREDAVVLDVLGVHPGAQGRGIGTRLVEGIQAQMKARSVGTLRTQVAWPDRGMVRFLASAGFGLSGIQCVERDTAPLDESGDDRDPSRDRVHVRSLDGGDLAEVARIDHSLTGRDRTAYFAAKIQEMLTESGIRVSLVSEEGGVLTGYIMARVDFGEFGKVDPAAVIDTIGVHPAYAGSGIGHALLSQLLLNLSRLKVESVLTQVSPEDFALHRFLHACGFRQAQRLVLSKGLAVAGEPVPDGSLSSRMGVCS